MKYFNIGNLSKLFDIEMDNLPQPSSLWVILIEDTTKIGIYFWKIYDISYINYIL